MKWAISVFSNCNTDLNCIFQDLSESIQPYCKDGDALVDAIRCRILVCTCASAGMLYQLSLTPGHYTHAFIDEAGQATEPESVIAVGLVAGSNGQVCLTIIK